MRLINADALKKDIHSSFSDDLGILEHIDNAPTVEAIPYEKWEELKNMITEMAYYAEEPGTQHDACCRILYHMD